MAGVVSVLILTIKSFFKANLSRLALQCLLISVLLLIVLSFIFSWGIEQLIVFSSQFDIINFENWVGWFKGVFGVLFFIVGGWILLPLFSISISGLFEEKVINNIEKYQYGEAKGSVSQSNNLFVTVFRIITFTISALFLNLIILPFYLFGIGVFLGFILNAYLLGREFFEIVVNHYVGNKQFKSIWLEHKKKIWFHGLFLSLFSLVPLVNVIIPIVAMAWMTHLCRSMQLHQLDSLERVEN